MFKTSLTRKLAALTLAAAPLGAGTSVLASAVIGTPAAHATGEVACVDVQPGPGATDNVVSTPVVGVGSGQCGGGPNLDGSTAAINVCDGGGSANSPGGGLNTGANGDFGYSSGSGANPENEAWFNATGPSGQLEVDGIGIASEQTGC